jgi:hypothetical protein
MGLRKSTLDVEYSEMEPPKYVLSVSEQSAATLGENKCRILDYTDILL